jgi:hypothetical protein
MSVTIKGREYDFAGECMDCPGGPSSFGVFSTKAERQAWKDRDHAGHQIEFYLQGRV